MIPPTKRLNYFDHQFLRVDDFTDEQAYHLGMRRAHNRMLHTHGVAQGLTLGYTGSTVTVSAGVALDGDGREIVLPTNAEVQVPSELAGKTAYVTIAYGERKTDATTETGAAGDRRWEEVPSLRLAEAAPSDPETELVLGRVTIDASRNVSGTDDGEGALRRRVAGPAPGAELEVRSLAVQGDARVGGRLAATSRLAVGGAAGDAPLHVAGGNWDLTGEGDLKVGSATHRLKVGVALTGGGAGDVRIRAQGGTNRLLLGSGTADVVAIQNGNVGIGTGAAALPQQLTLTGAIGFANFNATDRRLFAPADGTLRWQTSAAAPTHAFEVGLPTGAAPVRLDAAGPSYLTGGSLGVGVATPDATLHVAGGRDFATTDGDLKVGTGANRLKVGVVVAGPAAGEARLRAEGTAARLILGAAGADVLTVTNAGVGIGAAPAPGAPLTVGSVLTVGAAGVGIGAAPAAGVLLTVAGVLDATELRQGGNPVFGSQWSNVAGGIAYTAGRVGLGLTAPGFRLDVGDRIRLREGPSGTAGLWLFQTAPNGDRAFIGMNGDNVVGLWGNAGAGFSLNMDVATGNVGIRSGPAAAGGAVLTVNGNVQVGGRVTDARLRMEAGAGNAVSIFNLTNNTVWNNLPNMSLSLTSPGAWFLIRFHMGGVQAQGVTQAHAEYRLLVDGGQHAFTLDEYHNNGWELRGVSLERMLYLAPGVHSVVVQWSIKSPQARAAVPPLIPEVRVTLTGSFYGDTRTLIAIEL